MFRLHHGGSGGLRFLRGLARKLRQRQQLAALREKWPLAFPAQHQDVRPLAMGVAREVAAAMGWSLPYTLGVLGRWKMSPVYCQAVLGHDQRIALDGAPAETVDAEAKDLATKRK
jgi:sRNA-binding protein